MSYVDALIPVRLLKRLRCFVFGHDVAEWVQLSERARCFRCPDCNRWWVHFNDGFDLNMIVPLTDDLADMYASFGRNR